MSEKAKSKSRAARRRKPPGSSPGAIVVDPGAAKPKLSVVAFGPDELVERTITDANEVCPLLERYPVVWLDVDGLGDADVIRSIAASFNLHRLAIEDVTEVHKRARIDRYGTHQYIALVMVAIESGELDTEQLSMFLGKNFVITFQERPGDGFDRVRERIRGGKGMIRTGGPGYLAYALLDATIDGYFPVLEHYGERLEALENALVAQPNRTRLHEIHALRRDLVVLRRAIWPMREALNFLLRESTDAFNAETRPYLNDCYDHTVQLMELVETQREMAGGLMDVYLSSMSNRMNEIMKVLTIIATIFIPLTFVTSVYGMNWPHIPEFAVEHGYEICVTLMAVLGLAMLFVFWRRGWLGTGRRRP
jgi:magnesium transporter